MRERGEGLVINIISTAAKAPSGIAGLSYQTAKYGMMGFGVSLNKEAWKFGIRTCNIYPDENQHGDHAAPCRAVLTGRSPTYSATGRFRSHHEVRGQPAPARLRHRADYVPHQPHPQTRPLKRGQTDLFLYNWSKINRSDPFLGEVRHDVLDEKLERVAFESGLETEVCAVE